MASIKISSQGPDVPTVDAGESGNNSKSLDQNAYDGPLELPKDKQIITILLVGETGCGKTAFMSLLRNLFLGRGPFELEDLHDKELDTGLAKSYSQTEKAKLYTFQIPNQGFTMRILDTPGLADSRGPEQDKKNQEEINNAIRKDLTTIDAVIIMSNGTTERLGPTTDYTLKVLMTLFPRSILENIGFIFTHVDSLSFNFQKDSLPPQLRKAQFWLIQNPLALLVKHNSMIQNETRNTRQVRQDIKTIERTYEDTIETLNEWLAWANQRPVQPTSEIHNLYEISTQIEARIDKTIGDITLLYEQRKEWTEIQSKLQDNHSRRRALDILRDQLGPRYIWARKETKPTWNTICMREDCHNNCHVQCSDDEDGGWIDDAVACGQFFRPRRFTATFWMILPPSFRFTYAGVCKSCDHDYSDHKRYQFKHVQERQDTDPALQRDLNAAEDEETRLKISQKAVSTRLEGIRDEVERKISTIRKLIDEFREISISYNFSGYIHSTIGVLEMRKRAFESEPGSAGQIAIINESIEKLKQKLTILDPPPAHGLIQHAHTDGTTRWWSDRV
ncbi:unnamed protein product [Rhizoctonia solani]|uniref:AIG1-type G domain-containing protein n=1 Tax=Rhizoctonia solani TaxID=456999 RepID=A0A8H3DWL4_9AGAM|nr:unnamed protein product [Rhizoctonia solani]CAE7106568.1 unnamed protein product [Rhizoctonia solani]